MIGTLVGIFLIAFLISHFEPLHWLIDLIPNTFIKSVLTIGFGCVKCLSFWITLGYTRDIMVASLMFFIVFWYDKIVGPYENKIKF